MKRLRYKVLFLASWYPNRNNPILGVFVRRKAEAMNRVCDIAVLHASDDPLLQIPYEIVETHDQGFPCVIVYFKTSSIPIIKGFVYNVRYFNSLYRGWRVLHQRWSRPDLIHVNVIDRAGYFALVMRWFRGLPFVITEHSTPDINYLRGITTTTHIPLKAIKRRVIQYSSALNVDSMASLRYLQKAGFKGKFVVIPNIVDINEKIVSETKKERTKKIAVHISILNERKNVAGIVRIVSKVWNEGRKNFEFHIVGEGEQKKELMDMASQYGTLNTCVFFRGRIDDNEKQQLLASASFHILNSDEEGFSVVTAEAISCGTPVIATRCGGPEDFVTPEVGILIERRDNEALEKAIIEMLDHSDEYDPEELKLFGKSHFSADHVAELTYAMYEKAFLSSKS